MTKQLETVPNDIVHDALKHWHTSIVESSNDFNRMKSTLTAIMPRINKLKTTNPVDVVATEAISALKKAEMFIENGVEFGFIRLPDHGDPALETLPIIKATIRALSAEPVQGEFDGADWFYRDIDPDDNGDTPYEAVVNQPEYSVHLVHSSYRGDSRYAFRAPTLNQDDDDDEVLHFATEEEAILASDKRRKSIEALEAAPTSEAEA